MATERRRHWASLNCVKATSRAGCWPASQDPAWREALDTRGAVAWPPPDLSTTQVRLQLLGPGEGNVLFDSDNPARGGTAAASAPFALAEFRRLLLPGETLRVQREGSEGVILEARGEAGPDEPVAPWIDALIRWLPVAGYDTPIESRSAIATRLGQYRLTLQGDLRSVNRQLATVATRQAGYVAAMLGAVIVVWLLLEVVVMRRIALLTQRAAAVSERMRAAAATPSTSTGGQRLNLTLAVGELRGRDERRLHRHRRCDAGRPGCWPTSIRWKTCSRMCCATPGSTARRARRSRWRWRSRPASGNSPCTTVGRR